MNDTLSNGMRVLDITVAACVFIVVAASVATFVWAHREWDIRRNDQVNACERGNAIRQELNVVSSHLRLGMAPLPVLDCQRTVQ